MTGTGSHRITDLQALEGSLANAGNEERQRETRVGDDVAQAVDAVVAARERLKSTIY